MKQYTTADPLLLVAAVILLLVGTFTAAVPDKKVAALPVAETRAVAHTLTDNAVTYVSRSSLVLPPAAVEWVLSARGYDANAH
jgi:hypothetical protein